MYKLRQQIAQKTASNLLLGTKGIDKISSVARCTQATLNMETIHDPHLNHLFDGDSVFNVYNEGAVNLSVGAPGPDLLQYCVEMIKTATDHRLEEERKRGKYYLFQYGITAGLWECREELAMFLTRRYGDPVKRENLISTCGASHGLQLLINTVLSPNGVIFVEEVTYMIALDVLKQFPLMKIVTVPMKDDVVDVEAFEKIVKDEKKNGDFLLSDEKIFWALFYTIPTFHNPTGSVLPPQSCKRLVEVARNNSIVVACDDVYNLLYYGSGSPPHRLFFYDDPIDPNYKVLLQFRRRNVDIVHHEIGKLEYANALYHACDSHLRGNTTVTAGKDFVKIRKLCRGILRSGGAVNHYVSGIITSLLHLKIQDAHLDRLVKVYGERLSVLCEVLDCYLPKDCSYQRPGGGYFVWIHLPLEINASDFIKWCQEEHKVSAIPGVTFSYAQKSRNFLRVSIGFHKKEVLEIASKTLCKAIASYTKRNIYSKES